MPMNPGRKPAAKKPGAISGPGRPQIPTPRVGKGPVNGKQAVRSPGRVTHMGPGSGLAPKGRKAK